MEAFFEWFNPRRFILLPTFVIVAIGMLVTAILAFDNFGTDGEE